MITFGPVPSRRLGRSLGINNIPPKICTYSCGYCHVGRTIKIQVDRKEHYKPNKILNDVRIQSPDESIINRTYQIFSEYIDHVEYLIGYEGNSFSFTGGSTIPSRSAVLKSAYSY